MNVVVLGAGEIGAYVAKTLSEEEHNVLLIDSDTELLERAARDSDIAHLHAQPSAKLLENLLEQKPDLFFAATEDDATNLLFSSIAKNIGFPKTVCRVKTPEYIHQAKLDFKRLFYVDHFLSPEIMAAQDLCKGLVHAKDLAVDHFAHGMIQMRTIQIPDHWDKGGTPISQLALPEALIAGLIRRKTASEESVLIPHGEDHILPGDHVTIIGETKMMHRLHEIFGTSRTDTRSVILVGGSTIALHLAHYLLEQKIHVRIIEKDKARCEMLAELVPEATIIYRDGRDPSLMQSERVQDADALVSCTSWDETNLMIALMAKEMGSPKPIALITHDHMFPILDRLGVIPALSPRVHVANKILSLLDEKTTLSINSLSSDAAKIVELKILSTSKTIGIPLANLGLPKELLIAVIESKGNVTIGKGNRILCPEDIVIAICHARHIPKLQHLFH